MDLSDFDIFLHCADLAKTIFTPALLDLCLLYSELAPVCRCRVYSRSCTELIQPFNNLQTRIFSELTMLTKPMMSMTRVVLQGLQARCLSSGGKTSALIIGAPGSGKGTISNWIVRDFGLVHVSSGDLLRAHLRDGTPLGLEAKSYITAGDLVPDKVMVGLVSSELKQLGSQAWLLDGFPRTQPQAEALQAETPVNVVVNLCVPFETIIDRIKDRWIHPGSGRVYNLVFNPPKVTFICSIHVVFFKRKYLVRKSDFSPKNQT